MALEDRRLLSGETTLQLDYAAGINIAVINLPAGATSFTGISTSASGGVAFQSPINASQVVYQSGGLTNTDTFSFSYNNAAGQTQTYGVTVQIPTMPPPVIPPPPVVPPPPVLPPGPGTFNMPPMAQSGSEIGMHNIPMTGNNARYVHATDPEMDPLTYSVNTLPTHGTLDLQPNGRFYYTPNHNYFGPDSFTFKVTDNKPRPVNTPVIGVEALFIMNTKPMAMGDSFFTGRDEPKTDTVAMNDMLGLDPGTGDASLFTKTDDPQNGSVTLNASTGVFTYTPNAGYVGVDTFKYKLSDGVEVSEAVTVTIQVMAPTVSITSGDSFREILPNNPADTRGTGSFFVTRTGNLSSPLTVNLDFAGQATLNDDYALRTGMSVTLPAGIGGMFVYVDSINNKIVEGSETVVGIIKPNSQYMIGTLQATIMLHDNDIWEWIVRTPFGPNYGTRHGIKPISQSGYDGKIELTDTYSFGHNRYHEDYTATYLDPNFLGDVTNRVLGSLDLAFS